MIGSVGELLAQRSIYGIMIRYGLDRLIPNSQIHLRTSATRQVVEVLAILQQIGTCRVRGIWQNLASIVGWPHLKQT